MTKLDSIQKSLASLIAKIIAACKKAVEAFKEHGVAALNGAIVVFDIKHDLELTRGSINSAIDYNHGQIAKLEAASAEMHAAGRALRNIGRAIKGKEPIPGIRPNGRLARLAEAPFRSEVRRLNRSLGRVNKALAQIDKLEKAAALRTERGRPSVLEDMREKRAKIGERKTETPVKVKTAETER